MWWRTQCIHHLKKFSLVMRKVVCESCTNHKSLYPHIILENNWNLKQLLQGQVHVRNITEDKTRAQAFHSNIWIISPMNWICRSIISLSMSQYVICAVYIWVSKKRERERMRLINIYTNFIYRQPLKSRALWKISI